jgi:hypothetical protein
MVSSLPNFFPELADEIVPLLVRHPHRGAVPDAPLRAPQAVLVLDRPLVPENSFLPKSLVPADREWKYGS